jgi:acyl-CoA synthetase (AMP-forming)/AMP-acid ligase II
MNAERPLLQHLLADSTSRSPAHPAFVAEGVELSYEQLMLRATRVAAGLQEWGVRKGDRVALVLDACAEYPIALYGILLAGAAVVPCCPDTRARSLHHILSHAQVSAAVLEPQNLVHLPAAGEVPSLRTIVTTGDGSAADAPAGMRAISLGELEGAGAQSKDVSLADSELASIIYTSGTTGAPKGVMLSHRNLVSNVRSIVQYLQLGPRDIAAMTLPFYYVYGNSVLHTHLAAGGTVAWSGTLAFPSKVLQSIERYRCTGLPGVPSTFARLVQLDSLGAYDLGSLRYVTQAGGAMSPALTDKLRAALPGVRIVIMYGQTEASARLAWLPPEDLHRKPGSAGKAIPGVTLAVVDSEGNEVPRGVVGEIVARGDNIMLGYWRAPEETARALRPEGLRTGDLARMDEEGFIYIVGRDSEMIKSGAHRIGPREIEDVVELMPEVAQCAVVGIPDELLGEAIVAFMVPAAGCEVSAAKVMQTCLKHLPRFKLPAHLRLVQELPRTATGKLNRLALRTWFSEGLGAPAR